jgi:molecular chaperone HscB
MDLCQNYFALFNLPQRFMIDQKRLADSFRKLQREVHPDRHIGKGKHQQLLAMRFASYINTAYQTLKSPLLRAGYLLELAQIPMSTQADTITDGDFLFQQMQWRETLAKAVELRCKQTLTELSQTVLDHHEKLLSTFTDAYDQKEFDNAKETIAKLHFVEKIMAEIEQAKHSDAMNDCNLVLCSD